MNEQILAERFEWADNVARKYTAKLPRNVPLDDMQQEARLGVLDAMKRWRPEDGEFKAFAHSRVIGNMLDWLRTTDIIRSRRKFHLLVIPFSAMEIASYRYAGDETPWNNIVYTKENPLTILASRDGFTHLLNIFSGREREIMRLRYEEGRTQTEIAKKVMISESRVSQVLASCIVHLRKVICVPQ